MDDFCDEDEENDLQDEDLFSTCNAGFEHSDSDADSSKDKQDSVAASIVISSFVATPSDNSSFQNIVGELKAQNGTVWKNITSGQGMGRASADNFCRTFCHRAVVQSSPYSAFHLCIDEYMLRCIQNNTINHGKKDDDNFDLHLDELERFICL